MGKTETEPRLITYLHAKAARLGEPLAGTFELTPRCNFDCKMCYVHLTEDEMNKRGKELSADEWLDIAEKARLEGMLFLLLTGGEPLFRRDFKYIFTELKKMGFLISINSNASLINKEWLDFFEKEPPFRFNISLYGASDKAYRDLCGAPVFERVRGNIEALTKIGIGVKMNVSLTPYNAADLEKIYDVSCELGVPMQAANYMFPPIRKDENSVGKNDRFTSHEAACVGLRWDKLRFDEETLKLRAEAIKNGLELPREEACEGAPGEKISCRAGKSTFWINWLGNMTPCGMMTEPAFSVREFGFSEAWKLTKEATDKIRMPAECSSCKMKHACHICAAMCYSETGSFDKKPEYICKMTEDTVRMTTECEKEQI